jgi:hypothetical protein
VFVEILKHTPMWVFVLFFLLLVLGYFQSKPRIVSLGRVAVLPVVMIVLSLYGVWSAFGVSVSGIAAWFVGVGFAVFLNQLRTSPQGVAYSRETKSFVIPGSWLPLALMMAIFFTKYAVGVVLARKLSFGGTPLFIGGVSLIYGFLSGMFFSRVLGLWRIARKATEQLPNSALNRTRADNARAG